MGGRTGLGNMQLLLFFFLLTGSQSAPSPDKLVVAPPDGYLPALDDSLDSYEGSGGDEGSGEGGGRAAGEGEAGLDGYDGSGQDNLVEAESTTENPTEEAPEPIENNLVEEE